MLAMKLVDTKPEMSLFGFIEIHLESCRYDEIPALDLCRESESDFVTD
jgi:hypothetical protein